jgi:hypothetical protein
LDALLITSLKHFGDSDNARQNQFELTLEGFIDARTSWFERVNLIEKANGQLREPDSNSRLLCDTPQELLAAVGQYGNGGSYEDFVTLFSDEGVRDLAGSLLMSASVVTVSGTQLKLGERVLGEISHHRLSSGPGLEMLLDPDGKKRHCNGRYEFRGGLEPEYKKYADAASAILTLEVCELQDDPDATKNSKQTYEFRPVSVEKR